jgi:hypothetical protein
LPGASAATCLTGECQLEECIEGLADCNEESANGCEQDIAGDPDNCGECHKVCELPDAVAGCEGGNCVVADCVDGLGDCDLVPATGCETSLDGTIAHCGECSQPCHQGTSFANALVACEGGICKFQGCMVGFDDENGDCADGGKCGDGCEACSPLADGTVEIPDDGADNDCTDGDVVNDENRGYYVDPLFEFTDDCVEPGLGTRACPFRGLLNGVYEAQVEQDWGDPEVARREIYVAIGTVDPGQLPLEFNKSIFILGGYQRTAQGPWTRVPGGETVLKSGTAPITAGGPPGWWAVLDNLRVSPEIKVNGQLVVRRVTAAPGSTLVVQSVAAESRLHLQECTVTGHVKDTMGASYWTVAHSEVGGDVDGTTGDYWKVISNTIGGSVDGTDSCELGKESTHWTISDNTIVGDIRMEDGDAWSVLDNDIGGHIQSSKGGMSCHESKGWSILRNKIGGGIKAPGASNFSVADNQIIGEIAAGSSWKFVRNRVQGNVSFLTQAEVYRNLISGQVSMQCACGPHIWYFVGNTMVAPAGFDQALLVVGGDNIAVANNLFVWQGEKWAPYFAIEEIAGNFDPSMVANNAFAGFDSGDGALYLNEATSSLASVMQLNTLADLPPAAPAATLKFPLMRVVSSLSIRKIPIS